MGMCFYFKGWKIAIHDGLFFPSMGCLPSDPKGTEVIGSELYSYPAAFNLCKHMNEHEKANKNAEDIKKVTKDMFSRYDFGNGIHIWVTDEKWEEEVNNFIMNRPKLFSHKISKKNLSK